jgi:hypothetical protein
VKVDYSCPKYIQKLRNSLEELWLNGLKKYEKKGLTKYRVTTKTLLDFK